MRLKERMEDDDERDTKSQFSLMQWLAELIIRIRKPDDQLKIIEGCIELMNNSDLAEYLTPYIVLKYLSSAENCAKEITEFINKILEKGHTNHKLIITRTIIILENWFKKELRDEKQASYDPTNPNSIIFVDTPMNLFLRNFAHIRVNYLSITH